ncbi:LysR substrate binding domain-containing protein [Vibrio crassostreae]|uniref:Uncharacterized protein n=1 Tax=Vibrio crassostreae TaxID=246167 RepID=A0A822MTV4_9VIBR|nr:LysR substrate binding domain-containing protein [Vibrio crassostreae]CAK2091683.1 LysR substrate binding domain-containing protein [Vibrio crassostreae]CAK2104174.1 LysR substrate binding domain-containing protein [Vibrio crassostreae]CAK2117884.1 LysR substrate binding domain-containing protein [Vibrio crassostreae]CAK2117946.1 LysR substrate binding domain-containing protein [Vibrio crassostreae]
MIHALLLECGVYGSLTIELCLDIMNREKSRLMVPIDLKLLIKPSDASDYIKGLAMKRRQPVFKRIINIYQ